MKNNNPPVQQERVPFSKRPMGTLEDFIRGVVGSFIQANSDLLSPELIDLRLGTNLSKSPPLVKSPH